jgi:hypothetical protein
MKLTPGSRWKSGVCAAEAVVVRAGSEAGDLECGGVAMIAFSAERSAVQSPISPSFAGGCLLGKRYVDAESGFEVLCTKAGEGALSFSGRLLAHLEPKKLPSSD